MVVSDLVVYIYGGYVYMRSLRNHKHHHILQRRALPSGKNLYVKDDLETPV